MAQVVLLEDYKLEEWISRSGETRCAACAGKAGESASCARNRILQYAVNQAVSDFYALPPKMRSYAKAEQLARCRWDLHMAGREGSVSSGRNAAGSPRTRVAENLAAFLTDGEPEDAYPMVLFEQHRAFVDELNVEMTMIVHALDVTAAGGYRMRKFAVDERPEVIHAYRHLATAFCFFAFGKIPEIIEALGVLSGRRYTFVPDMTSLDPAVDFIRILRDSWRAGV
ncbi:hypothetical protein ACFQWB_04020 [Paenibacillus thermoaerophilus]|uniref:Uncharacterized protein n=1 Tax=Paenibacillus thermoaerophilus TaxID=1215385 RepID=A0ABW2V499_9BACL|nr:hypothetical protein [Paenibacillus thermoaerophilus]TMV16000.1 hypothetical protein FE781_09255 [Paenibacillus thermoaerophilus]